MTYKFYNLYVLVNKKMMKFDGSNFLRPPQPNCPTISQEPLQTERVLKENQDSLWWDYPLYEWLYGRCFGWTICIKGTPRWSESGN